MQYAGDGTRAKCRYAIRRRLNEQVLVVRKATMAREMYLHRVFLQRKPLLGPPIIFTMVDEPLPCVSHTTWVLFNMADGFVPLLPELGFTGLSLTVYVFDGGTFGALYRRMRQRHRAHYAQIEDLDERTRTSHMDMYEGILCALHKVQTCLGWGVKQWLDCAKELDELWIVLASLRNAFDIVCSHIHEVYRNVTWVRDPTDLDNTIMTQFWVALGIPTNTVESLVELGIWWDPTSRTLVLYECVQHLENWQ